MLVVQSSETDVYRNLAIEEWLLDHAPEGPVLFLCANDPCVVIGKNQNPWRECRLSLMGEEEVRLARRISGGGAVYHDPGNLNVGIIVPRASYREEKQYELIFKTLEQFGLQSSILGKNSLAVDGLKYSGQAFCYRRERVLHHGTILVNADLKRLGRYLGPEVEGIVTKAVASVPAKVVNLSQLAPDMNIENLCARLIEEFTAQYGAGEPVEFMSGADCLKQIDLDVPRQLESPEWSLYKTPKFNVGNAIVEKGRVVNAEGSPLFDRWLTVQNAGI